MYAREREGGIGRERDSHVSISKTKVSIPTAECMLEREGGIERERETPMYQYLRLKFPY